MTLPVVEVLVVDSVVDVGARWKEESTIVLIHSRYMQSKIRYPY